jgi:ureidoacrylate peracid hydrolase
MHNIEINPELLQRLKHQRGGRLHLFDDLQPSRTAHLVIDLQNGFMEPGAPVEVPLARDRNADELLLRVDSSRRDAAQLQGHLRE